MPKCLNTRFYSQQLTCMKKSMPTAIVVPSAKPKAKSVAAKAGTLKGMRGWNWRTALMSIFTVLQPNEICSEKCQLINSKSNCLEKNCGVIGHLEHYTHKTPSSLRELVKRGKETTNPFIKLCVHGHDEDDGGMWATQWSQQQEAGEVGVILVAATVVDPGAVVVHLHHAPGGWEAEERRSAGGIDWLFGRT